MSQFATNLQGYTNAKNIALFAARHVPAYRKLLLERGFKLNQIRSESFELSDLPILDKQNYIHKNSISELVPTSWHITDWHASSGSSGKPTFWPRHHMAQEYSAVMHAWLLEHIWKIPQGHKVLVVIGFSFGLWVAGPFTSQGFYALAKTRKNLTVVTPGLELDAILSVIAHSGTKDYDTIILAGYPTLLTRALEEIDSSSEIAKKLYLLAAGDKVTKAWREQARAKLGWGNKMDMRILSVYGSADLTFMGSETPLTRYLSEQKGLWPELENSFQQFSNETPVLYQYLPEYLYSENHEEELLYTSLFSVPLVRYNLRDRGASLKMPKQIREKLQKIEDLRKFTSLPLILKADRTDTALSFYAMNLLPQHLHQSAQNALPSASTKNSIAWYIRHTGEGKKEKLVVNVGSLPQKQSRNELAKKLSFNLKLLSTEYNKLSNVFSKDTLPVVESRPLASIKHKYLLIEPGKKPRVVKYGSV